MSDFDIYQRIKSAQAWISELLADPDRIETASSLTIVMTELSLCYSNLPIDVKNEFKRLLPIAVKICSKINSCLVQTLDYVESLVLPMLTEQNTMIISLLNTIVSVSTMQDKIPSEQIKSYFDTSNSGKISNSTYILDSNLEYIPPYLMIILRLQRFHFYIKVIRYFGTLEEENECSCMMCEFIENYAAYFSHEFRDYLIDNIFENLNGNQPSLYRLMVHLLYNGQERNEIIVDLYTESLIANPKLIPAHIGKLLTHFSENNIIMKSIAQKIKGEFFNSVGIENEKVTLSFISYLKAIKMFDISEIIQNMSKLWFICNDFIKEIINSINEQQFIDIMNKFEYTTQSSIVIASLLLKFKEIENLDFKPFYEIIRTANYASREVMLNIFSLNKYKSKIIEAAKKLNENAQELEIGFPQMLLLGKIIKLADASNFDIDLFCENIFYLLDSDSILRFLRKHSFVQIKNYELLFDFINPSSMLYDYIENKLINELPSFEDKLIKSSIYVDTFCKLMQKSYEVHHKILYLLAAYCRSTNSNFKRESMKILQNHEEEIYSLNDNYPDFVEIYKIESVKNGKPDENESEEYLKKAFNEYISADSNLSKLSIENGRKIIEKFYKNPKLLLSLISEYQCDYNLAEHSGLMNLMIASQTPMIQAFAQNTAIIQTLAKIPEADQKFLEVLTSLCYGHSSVVDSTDLFKNISFNSGDFMTLISKLPIQILDCFKIESNIIKHSQFGPKADPFVSFNFKNQILGSISDFIYKRSMRVQDNVDLIFTNKKPSDCRVFICDKSSNPIITNTINLASSSLGDSIYDLSCVITDNTTAYIKTSDGYFRCRGPHVVKVDQIPSNSKINMIFFNKRNMPTKEEVWNDIPISIREKVIKKNEQIWMLLHDFKDWDKFEKNDDLYELASCAAVNYRSYNGLIYLKDDKDFAVKFFESMVPYLNPSIVESIPSVILDIAKNYPEPENIIDVSSSMIDDKDEEITSASLLFLSEFDKNYDVCQKFIQLSESPTFVNSNIFKHIINSILNQRSKSAKVFIDNNHIRRKLISMRDERIIQYFDITENGFNQDVVNDLLQYANADYCMLVYNLTNENFLVFKQLIPILCENESIIDVIDDLFEKDELLNDSQFIATLFASNSVKIRNLVQKMFDTKFGNQNQQELDKLRNIIKSTIASLAESGNRGNDILSIMKHYYQIFNKDINVYTELLEYVFYSVPSVVNCGDELYEYLIDIPVNVKSLTNYTEAFVQKLIYLMEYRSFSYTYIAEGMIKFLLLWMTDQQLANRCILMNTTEKIKTVLIRPDFSVSESFAKWFKSTVLKILGKHNYPAIIYVFAYAHTTDKLLLDYVIEEIANLEYVAENAIILKSIASSLMVFTRFRVASSSTAHFVECLAQIVEKINYETLENNEGWTHSLKQTIATIPYVSYMSTLPYQTDQYTAAWFRLVRSLFKISTMVLAHFAMYSNEIRSKTFGPLALTEFIKTVVSYARHMCADITLINNTLPDRLNDFIRFLNSSIKYILEYDVTYQMLKPLIIFMTAALKHNRAKTFLKSTVCQEGVFSKMLRSIEDSDECLEKFKDLLFNALKYCSWLDAEEVLEFFLKVSEYEHKDMAIMIGILILQRADRKSIENIRDVIIDFLINNKNDIKMPMIRKMIDQMPELKAHEMQN